MKVKTSITLSSDLLEDIRRLEREFRSRSELIEEALQCFVRQRAKQHREEKDLKILNAKAKTLNEEAEDVLSYQVDL